MGFWSNLWSGIKKVGSSIASGAKKVGGWVQEGAKKVGEIGGKVVDVARQVAPYVKDIPIVGQVVGAVSKADRVVDLARQIGSGDWKQAVGTGLEMAGGLGGRLGELGRAGSAIYREGRRFL